MRKDIPKVNKTYKYFDDGKIRLSRMDNAIINKVVPFNKIDNETLEAWKTEVVQCDWLYSSKTDFFVKAFLERNEENVIFVRTKQQGWFSLGWWAGELDIDGTLERSIEEYS